MASSVQQQEVGPVHQRQSQAQPLLHAQGKVLKDLFSCVGQVSLLQHLVHRSFAGDTPLDAIVFQVLPGGEVGIEAGGLYHDPGTGTHLHEVLTRGPEEGDLPRRRHGLTGHHADDGGLSGAVAAYQAIDLALLHRQLRPVHRSVGPVPLGQALCV